LRRRAGFVFQGAALFDSLSVFENVAYPLREHTRSSEGEIATASTAFCRSSACPGRTTSCPPSCRVECASAWGSRAPS
jgi:phospholipid/cholesterol/gamma-HCH transport system ATP-binding protein